MVSNISKHPLSGPRKIQRDSAISGAVCLAKKTKKQHMVWMDRFGDYHITELNQRIGNKTIAIVYPNGGVAYRH